MSPPPPDYIALVSSWVRELIPELERALIDGTLLEQIEKPDVQEVLGPMLLQRYRLLGMARVRHDLKFRTFWINTFLQEFAIDLRQPKKLFPACAVRGSTYGPNSPLPKILVSHFQGTTRLRARQILAARRWGVWFEFSNALLDELYTHFLINAAREALDARIKNLWNLEATFLAGASKLNDDVLFDIDALGHKFEDLMLDVLNETKEVAWPAPLAEDILERTDLRVGYESVKRKGGARIQISLATDPAILEKKKSSFLAPEEFIWLTPFDLATFALKPSPSPQFHQFPWNTFWAAMGHKFEFKHSFAFHLHDLFADVLHAPVVHPLGPLWLLPPVLRDFIRRYTEHHAVVTSARVKEYEDKYGPRPGSANKYIQPPWKPRPAPSPPRPTAS